MTTSATLGESRRISRLLAEEDDGEDEDDEPLRGVGYRLHRQIKTDTSSVRWVKRNVAARAIFVQGSLWVWSATSRGHPPARCARDANGGMGRTL